MRGTPKFPTHDPKLYLRRRFRYELLLYTRMVRFLLLVLLILTTAMPVATIAVNWSGMVEFVVTLAKKPDLLPIGVALVKGITYFTLWAFGFGVFLVASFVGIIYSRIFLRHGVMQFLFRTRGSRVKSVDS